MAARRLASSSLLIGAGDAVAGAGGESFVLGAAGGGSVEGPANRRTPFVLIATATAGLPRCVR
jgi:hypothetical protein